MTTMKGENVKEVNLSKAQQKQLDISILTLVEKHFIHASNAISARSAFIRLLVGATEKSFKTELSGIVNGVLTGRLVSCRERTPCLGIDI